MTEALNSIVDRTADRRRNLENVLPLADEYHDDLQKLAEVISKVEDKLNKQRAFGAEPKNIKEEIEEIKVRFSDVLRKNTTNLKCFIRPIKANNAISQ